MSKAKRLMKNADRLFQQQSIGKRCRSCGQAATVMHHVIGRRNIAHRYDIKNGVPLCFACHGHVHSGTIKLSYPYPRLEYKTILVQEGITEIEFIKRAIDNLQKKQ